MRGVEEPLLPEPRAVEGGTTQSEGAIETQKASYPWLHQTARLRSLDVWVEISKPLLKHAKLRPIRFHDLRHTCATLLLSKDVNPKVVSEMLGHASVSITLDIYSH